ncbi:putative 3-hydroxyacyl-CoA dehydrogenase [Exophiala viscosa]|uniref:3-hydroxyacyl-CoA dehydrogenase n=2 Tax=Exophiala viscosa TaxID=2486360 RepID=A0AAN6E235_9EURO|nr:putative 3-hydroxyacyl-CoA dehydrogenase [Exophiala viscosa]
MPKFEPVPSSFGNLKDKVVVLTGGAHGVGESVIRYLYGVGAHVFFGDIDDKACQTLVDDLKAGKTSSTSLQYIPLDVRKYEDNLALFKLAYEKHGRIDHAFSIAGVTERQNWFEASLDLKTVETPPSTLVLDVNLTGLCYFARIATVYLRQGNDDHSQDKSICLLGSIASFKEQAGLFIYQPSKHGVIGLMRSTRKLLYHEYGIRINTICPSLINTGMASHIHSLWLGKGLPVNEADEVAQYVLTLTSIPQSPFGNMTGLAVYVEGGKGWEFENDLYRTDSDWLGEENSKNTARIDEALGIGLSWTASK